MISGTQASWEPAALCVSSPNSGLETSYSGLDWRGRPVTERSLFAAYCNTKPFVACAVLHLVDVGEIALSDTVGSILAGSMSPAVRDVKIFDLLSHQSGLRCFGAVGIRALEPSLRWDFIAHLEEDDAGKVPGFADAEPWFILGRVLETVFGNTYQRAVQALVLDRYGIEDVVLDSHELDLDRVALSGVVEADFELAALSDLSPSVAAEWNPAFGGHLAAAGLHRLACGVALDREGASLVLSYDLSRLATSAIASAPGDGTFSGGATFGLGFLVNGPERWIDGRLSPNAFGHVNQGGRGFTIVDPDPKGGYLAITGCFLDSINDSKAVVQRRRDTTHRICDDHNW